MDTPHAYTLETRMFFDNNYDEDYDDYDTFQEIVDALARHTDFRDKRRDKRFIVKFYDLPAEAYDSYAFDGFCEQVYTQLMEDLENADVDIKHMLTSQTYGHYPKFRVDIPEITNDNIYELAEQIYDETQDAQYVDDYVTATTMLQDIEDNYTDWWEDYYNDTKDLYTQSNDGKEK